MGTNTAANGFTIQVDACLTTSQRQERTHAMADLYSRRSFLAGVLAAGSLSTTAAYLFTRRSSVTLKLVTGADSTGGRRLLITMWNELNPSTTIEVEEITSSTNDQFDKFTGNHADIYNLDTIHIPRFADAGRIRPVTPEGDLSLLTPVRRICEVDGSPGEYWAVPFNTDVGMLFRRITDKRVPDDAPSLKQVLAEAPQQFVGQLATGGTQTGEAFVVNVLEHALAQDETILAEDGTMSFSLGQWRTALQPLAEAVRQRRVLAEAGEENTTKTFHDRNLRYMRNWPVEYRALDRAERTKPDTAEIRVGPLPVGILGGQSLGIAEDTRHRSEAERAVRFLTDIPAQKLLATFGFAPTGIDAYTDSSVQAVIPHLGEIRNAVERSRPRPIHHNYAEFATRFKEHTEKYLYGGQDLSDEFVRDIRGALR
jgi:multiple sugar transport system substrate-binding protein